MLWTYSTIGVRGVNFTMEGLCPRLEPGDIAWSFGRVESEFCGRFWQLKLQLAVVLLCSKYHNTDVILLPVAGWSRTQPKTAQRL